MQINCNSTKGSQFPLLSLFHITLRIWSQDISLLQAQKKFQAQRDLEHRPGPSGILQRARLPGPSNILRRARFRRTGKCGQCTVRLSRLIVSWSQRSQQCPWT